MYIVSLLNIVRLQEGSSNQKFVTIPIELVRAMGWEKGDELSFSVQDSDTLEITRK